VEFTSQQKTLESRSAEFQAMIPRSIHGAKLNEERERTMQARDLERYKKLLLAKRDELSAPSRSPSPVPPAGEAEGDMMDKASAEAAADLQIRLHATEGKLLKAVEDALGRIRTGTFGKCEVCKQSISKNRLQAVPWTRLCRNCKDQESDSN
jgi:DnaK suppressor protein